MDTNTKLSYQQIMIGRAMTGLIGLREALERLAQEGIAPDDPKVGSRLLAEIRKHNYVPRPAIAEYEQALIREYRRYLQAREKGTQEHLWRDPRKEHHPWFPTIFEEKCDGCGACLGGTQNTPKCSSSSPMSALQAASCAPKSALEKPSSCHQKRLSIKG